jgi:hypothetical protein
MKQLENNNIEVNDEDFTVLPITPSEIHLTHLKREVYVKACEASTVIYNGSRGEGVLKARNRIY